MAASFSPTDARRSKSKSGVSANQERWLTVSNALIAITGLALIAYVQRKRRPKDNRRLSGYSKGLVDPFPPQYRIPPSVMYPTAQFDELPTEEALRGLCDGFFRYDRFNSVLINDEQGPRFKATGRAHPDYDYHLKQTQVSSPDEVLEAIGSLIDKPLDPKYPLWQILAFKNSSGRSFLVFRCHHAISDGLRFILMFMDLMTTADGKPFKPPEFVQTWKSAKTAASPLVRAWNWANKFIESFNRVTKLGVAPPDTLSPFRPELNQVYSGHRKVIFFPDVSVSDVKAVKTASGTTVNDVISSMVAGAFRRYLEYRKDPSISGDEPIQLRAMVPVTFPMPRPPLEQRFSALHNYWVGASVPLPVDIPSDRPLDRLKASKENWDRIKDSKDIHVARFMAEYMAERIPLQSRQKGTFEVLQRHSCVFSNVLGPPEELFLGGKPMKDIHAVFFNIISQLTVLSYNGSFKACFVTDHHLVTDPLLVGTFYVQELQSLKNALGLR